jgi:hypothetical protein
VKVTRDAADELVRGIERGTRGRRHQRRGGARLRHTRLRVRQGAIARSRSHGRAARGDGGVPPPPHGALPSAALRIHAGRSCGHCVPSLRRRSAHHVCARRAGGSSVRASGLDAAGTGRRPHGHRRRHVSLHRRVQRSRRLAGDARAHRRMDELLCRVLRSVGVFRGAGSGSVAGSVPAKPRRRADHPHGRGHRLRRSALPGLRHASG